MVVKRSSVTDYFARKLADSAKAKRFTVRALDAKLGQLRPTPRFATKPYKHQKVCFLLGVKHPQYLLFLDVGTGKTKISLDLVSYWKRLGKIKRTLVLVPYASNVGEWEDQAKLHAPKLRVVGIDQYGREARLEALDEPADVNVITYAGWLHLISTKVRIKKKVRMVIDEEKARKLERKFTGLIGDECTFLRHRRSLTFRAFYRLAKRCPVRYGLTGTPFDKKPEDLWAQFYATDRGDTLGSTQGIFRAAFFIQKERFWGRGFDYVFDERKMPELSRMIRHRSIRYAQEECSDLPASIGGIGAEGGPMVRPVRLSPETREYYNKIIDGLTEARGNFTLLDNAYHRMRQLTAGFLVYKDPEGQKVEIRFRKNPKVDALIDLLNELAPDKKVIVYNEYRTSGELICERLKKEKIRHVRIYSKTSDKKGVIAKFKEDKRCRVLVGSRTIAYGLNLQANCHYMIFFECPDSSLIRKQVEGRIRRDGQKKRPHFWDLAIRRTVDEKILRLVRKGKSLHDAIVDGKGAGLRRV